MATVPNNNLKKSLYWDEDGRVIASPSTINEGDMAYFDATAFQYKPLDSDAHAATFYGVFGETNPVVSLGDRTAETRGITIYRQGKFDFKTVCGDVYHDNDLVYYGGDAQTVTSTPGANSVGFVVLPGQTQVVTGASGVKIPVVIESYRWIA